MAVTVAFPQQRVGGEFTQEAIRQAQNSQLIPQGAQIQNVSLSTQCNERWQPNYSYPQIIYPSQVQEGIEIGAYESIPGNQRINLYEILGDQVPQEVIQNLQGQVDQIGKN